MKILHLLSLLVLGLLAAADDEMTSDPADVELANKLIKQFATDVMGVRTSEDIMDVVKWLTPSMTFLVCGDLRDQRGFLAFLTLGLVDNERFPTDWEIDAQHAYHREENFSTLVKTNGFMFEDGDELILDFKKQADGNYLLNHGTILTCKEKE